jgi:hypothetical protein
MNTSEKQNDKFKIGTRFGFLVVIKRWKEKKKNGKNENVCECQCDCGNVVIRNGTTLRNGHTKSCGCWQRRRNNRHHAWNGYGEISSSLWTGIKRAANYERSRLLEFSITIEQGWDLFLKQERRCALTGIELRFPEVRRRKQCPESYGTASLDRINSNLPYTLENVQWVHKDINLMKMALPQDVFINWCKIITAYQATKGR